MNTRVVLGILIALAMSISLVSAQSKEECTAKSASAKSCSKDGVTDAKASSTPAVAKSKIVLVGDKKTIVKTAEHCEGKDATECATKGTKASIECTEEEMAKCEMKKSSTTKVSTTKASMKKECCKEDAKVVKADKKAPVEKAEAKGTN